MADYIDRKTAINAICQEWCNRDYCGDCFFHGAKQAIAVLKALPDADVQPVRHGRWYKNGTLINCSVCKHCSWSIIPYEDLVKSFNYCPRCGADMRGEQNDG